MLCFPLYLRAIFRAQAPGAYIWRGDLTEDFLRYRFGGLIFEGLIHGGAYFRNFTLSGQSIEGWAGNSKNGSQDWFRKQ